jgi:hypothetical protein
MSTTTRSTVPASARAGLELQHLLARPRAGREHVAGQRQRARSEVHRGEGLAGLPEQVDDVRDALDVLEAQLARVVRVHLGLRRPVDDEVDEPGPPAVLLEDRPHAVRQGGFGFGLGLRLHSGILSRPCRRAAGECRLAGQHAPHLS